MRAPDARTPLDWSRLQAFLAICDTGAVARAAVRLRVTHAAVIRRLDGLEHALGTALFERRATEYVLTPAGEALRRDLDGLTPQIDAACEAVQGIDERIDGTIRLSTTDTLLQGLLMPHLQRFCETHPAIHLQVRVQEEAMASPLRRDADLAIRVTDQPPDHVVGRHVGDLAFRVYASAEHLRGRDARALDWIAIEASPAHAELDRWYRTHVAQDRIVLCMNSLVGMAEAAVQGVGAALLPRPLAERRAALVAIDASKDALRTQVWILSHADMRQVARVRTFAQAMDEGLRGDLGKAT